MWMEREDVERAVRIQRTGYRFLTWLETALERGFVSPERAADYAAQGGTARHWIERHWDNIPPEARPRRDEIAAFANYFTTYIDGSFTLVPDPHGEPVRDICEFYEWMLKPKHFVPVRLRSSDKKRARTMQRNYVGQLALDIDLELDPAALDALAARADLAVSIGLATYVADLTRRMQGFNEGAAGLVLWRTFAHDEHGSPRRGFELVADEAYAAQENVARALREAAGVST